MTPTKPWRIHRKEAGFALIVTLSLMILISILAVSLLTLSTLSMRSTSRSMPLSIAKANARLAFMIAIGDLQKHAGPDTRATARADILAAENPPVTGVWRSWEGDDHEPSGRPKTPDYASQKQQRFLAWLVSGNQASVPDTSPKATKVTLVGPGTIGAGADREKLQIHLPASLLKQGSDTTGGMAWWISGENQKARIPAPYKPETDTGGKWAMQMKSHAVADPEVFRMENLSKDETLAHKAISINQTDFIALPGSLRVANEFYHDLSASSVGLLTNAATGGWKKDLSLFSENQSLIGTAGLPLFRISPTAETNVTLATSNTNRGTQSVFYPWSKFGGQATTRNTDQNGAVASWNNLLDYTQIYKKTGGNGSTIPINFYQILGNSDTFQYLHQVRILPVVARTQWVHSYYAVPPIPQQAGVLQAAMVVTPVVTLWNPYNLSITTNSLKFTFGLTTQGSQTLPLALKFTVGGVADTSFQSLTPNSNYSNGGAKPSLINVASNKDELIYRIEQPFTLLPGETKVFSPSPTTLVEDTEVALAPGYNPGTGHLCKLRKNNGTTTPPPFTASSNSTISAEAVFNAYTRISATYPTIVGNDLTVEVNGSGNQDLRHRLQFSAPDIANIYKLQGSISQSPPLGTLTTSPVPFLTTVFGLRMASNTQNPTKGFLQSSPFISWPAFGPYIGGQRGKYTGTDAPANASTDYSFNAVTPTDSKLPNAAGSKGFIVTGFQSGDGLSRCVVAELPTRPLQSIGELQHWDMRYDNPTPPYGFNLVGNSDATPLLPADSAISSSNTFPTDENLRHDDSYCANHLLFDDWFFSSIAPDPDDFGVSGSDIQKVYSDFVSGTKKLPNAAYRPINADRIGDPSTLYDTHVKTADSWKTIASRLEVEGMFNVNSTSRAAWRAILGHARNQKIPYLDVGTTSPVNLSAETDFAVSRFSVSGDSDTSSPGSSGAFEDANEFVGYRILDEKMIDGLADAIVEQVRKRGPFLSLSEFVNRQLSSGDLAMAGAVQSALNEIAKNNSTNPYKGITGVMSRIALKDPGVSGHSDDGYEFPDAAEGETAFGLPGWTRQADILRPLAPTLTARDDTFTIRSYGDARDKAGSIIATAICEAVVQRTRDFVDVADQADKNVSNLSELNKKFGRRFEIVGFRWLNSNEI